MKKLLLTIAMLFILFSPPVNAQETENCKKMKARLADLEKKQKRNEYVISDEGKDEKMKADEKIAVISKYLKDDQRSATEMKAEMVKISKEYLFNWDSCYQANSTGKDPLVRCANLLGFRILNVTMDLRYESRYEKNGEIVRGENEINSLRNDLESQGCNEGNTPVSWSGTYTDGISIMTITGGAGAFSATWTYSAGDAKGTGSLTGRKIEGNKVTGDWKAQHEDDTKSGSRSGTFTANLKGNTITGQFLEDTPKWSWKTGYSPSNVQSRMFKGAVWPFSLARKQ